MFADTIRVAQAVNFYRAYNTSPLQQCEVLQIIPNHEYTEKGMTSTFQSRLERLVLIRERGRGPKRVIFSPESA